MQLRLLPGGTAEPDWVLDERTRKVGRQGVAQAREILRRVAPPDAVASGQLSPQSGHPLDHRVRRGADELVESRPAHAQPEVQDVQVPGRAERGDRALGSASGHGRTVS